jgi:hypothetical protein
MTAKIEDIEEKANNMEEWASDVKGAKIFQRLWSQRISKIS